MFQIKIIGSGVAGLCVAQELVNRETKITIIDKSDVPGPDSCSWWAGGMLAPWCEGESTEKIIVNLGQESIPWWSKNVKDVVQKGSLVVALSRDESELRRFSPIINDNASMSLLHMQVLFFFPYSAPQYKADLICRLKPKITGLGDSIPI